MGEREMSQNKSLQSKMPLAMGLAFVAFTTQFGGGFASGAQIYQYFINYGIWCLILPAVTQGLYALFSGMECAMLINTKPTITEAFPTVFTEKRNRLCPISMRSVT